MNAPAQAHAHALSTLPKMTVDQARYDEMLQKGFERFPKRKENYLKLKQKPREVVLDTLPGVLYLEPMGRCNFQCPMCDLQVIPSRRSGQMTFEQFKGIVDPLVNSVYEAKMPGVGEATLHRDIFDMIPYLADHHIWLHMATNGSLLDKKEAYRRLIDAGIGELTLSVDGATADVFETVRPGAVFDRVTKNFKLVNDYCNKNGLLRTRSFTTVQKTMRHQFREIVEYAAANGFRRHSFEFGLFDWGQEAMRETIESLRDHAPLTADEGWELVELGKKLGVEVSFLFLEHSLTLKNVCHFPFERIFVGSTMQIGPCTHIGYRGKDLGNGADVVGAWNGEIYRKFREDHLSGNIPPECRYCYKMN